MTRAEQRTLEQVDQKVDDLILRFDRFIKTAQWTAGFLVVLTGTIATVVIALK